MAVQFSIPAQPPAMNVPTTLAVSYGAVKHESERQEPGLEKGAVRFLAC
jgi:hypothetical protein